MASFDPDKDQILVTTKAVSKSGRGIKVTLHRYDGGVPKVQISRFFSKLGGEDRWAKLGRMSMDEWKKVRAAVDGVFAKAESSIESGNASSAHPKIPF